MIAALSRRGPEALGVALAAGLALLFGAILAKQPFVALGLVGVGLVAALAFLAPVLHLWMLIVLTAIVPYGLQNRFGIGGGQGAPGLLLSDVLLVTGLFRAAVALLGQPLDRRRTLHLAAVGAFLALATAQFAHGILLGREASVAGAELRALLGFGVFIIALPVVCNAPQRTRLVRALPVAGMILGLWGIAQWVLQIPFSLTGDVGVREGVALTTSGKGQVQGGLFAFPVAIIMATASLTLRRGLSIRSQLVLGAVILLNAAALVLTYERTFWIAALVGCGFVILRARPGERARALFIGCLALTALLVVFSTVAPGELTAARERFLSLGQHASDNSVRARIKESRVVLEQLNRHPVAGSGLGATIFYGRPWEKVDARSYTYTHNGYLWLAWKLGLPAAAALLALMGVALTYRGPADGGALWLALRNGAQGALLALLLASITFPVFNTESITPTMGLLLAVCAVPLVRPLQRQFSALTPEPPTVGPLEPALSRR